MDLFEAEDVVRLLQSEVERAGGPMAFSKKARVDRATVHRTLKRQEGPTRRIIRALDLRVVYMPKRDKLKANGLSKESLNEPRIEVLVLKDGQPRLFINGNAVKAMRAQVALLACLYDELGCVVPYERLCRIIGHQSSHERQLHILRQQMLIVRRLLTKHKARCSIAVAAGVGYALCEVARG
jgi:hypothetical protein